jgi:SAM-dependent methyltransferase
VPIPYDSIASEYDRTRGGLIRGGAFARVIAPLLPDGDGPIVDVGCATGAVAAPLRDLSGRPVIGLDLSPAMLTLARTRAPVCRADAHALPIGDACVDAAVLSWILHLVDDPADVMVDVARVLRPGGRVFVFEGRAEGDESPLRDVYARVEQALGRNDAATRARVAVDAAVAAGLAPCTEALSEDQPWEQSPAELARSLRDRLAGFLVDVDDATFDRHVQPAIDELMAMPDPERSRPRHGRHRCHVFERC